ncbi:MAG: carboxypeptidase-like regulatory domain-containing protein, partial [Acidobacteriota bacterium]
MIENQSSMRMILCSVKVNMNLNKLLKLSLIMLILPFSALSQTVDKASVRGKIVDQNNAAVVGAKIAVINESTGLRRDVVTDENGNYTITNLPLTGIYKVTVSRAGFADEEKSDIELRANETASVDVTLFPQGTKNEVTVTGTTESLQTDSARLETRLDLQKIDDTPILGRKLTNLVQLNSAVRPARGTGDLFLNNFLFVVNGNGRRQTNFSLDGSTG